MFAFINYGESVIQCTKINADSWEEAVSTGRIIKERMHPHDQKHGRFEVVEFSPAEAAHFAVSNGLEDSEGDILPRFDVKEGQEIPGECIDVCTRSEEI